MNLAKFSRVRPFLLLFLAIYLQLIPPNDIFSVKGSLGDESQPECGWGYTPGSYRMSDLKYGASGIGEAFLSLYKVTPLENRTMYRNMAQTAGNWIIQQNSAVDDSTGFRVAFWDNGTEDRYVSGLEEGNAGIGLYFLHLWEEFGNSTWLRYSEKIAQWISQIALAPGVWHSDYKGDGQLFSNQSRVPYAVGYELGSAGIGTFFGELYSSTGNESYLEVVNNTADYLVSLQQSDGSWIASEDPLSNETAYLGISWGVTGIARFLLDAYNLTGNGLYLKTAIKGLEWITDQQIALNSLFPRRAHELVPDFSYFDGSAGIASVFREFQDLNINDDLMIPLEINISLKNSIHPSNVIDGIINAAEQESGNLKWPKKRSLDSQDEFYTGKYYGVSGIANVLLEESLSTDNQSLLNIAEQGIGWTISQALQDPDVGGFIWNRSDLALGSQYLGTKYGTAGIILDLLNFYRVTGKQIYLETSLKAAENLMNQFCREYNPPTSSSTSLPSTSAETPGLTLFTALIATFLVFIRRKTIK